MPPIAKQDPEAIWSYGDPIMRSPKYIGLYGYDLCQLVSACLAVKPIDRPVLDELRTELDNIRPAQLTDADRAWFRRYLNHPSIPRARPVANAFR